MAKTTEKAANIVSKFREIQFSDEDIVNLDNWIPAGEYNPHNVRPFLLHDSGFVLCVVFASSLQEAIDEAVNNDKLDRYLIDTENRAPRAEFWDYVTTKFPKNSGQDKNCPEFTDENGVKYWWREGKEPAFLGNASEPFDIKGMDYVELPNPSRSFCAQFNAMNP